MKATILTFVLALSSVCMTAQEKSRLTIGGYGEAVMTRNFYSQSFNRYKTPENYANDPSHGRFDLPHICLNIGYSFGKGWTMGSEIEFEHGHSSPLWSMPYRFTILQYLSFAVRVVITFT